MAAYNRFNDFTEQLVKGGYNFTSDTIKVALSNTAPVASNSFFSDITEITPGNGYSAGGTAITNKGVVESSGTTTVSADQVEFTATGAMATFRYVVLYKDTGTASTSPLVAWWDNTTGVSLQSGEKFTVKFNNAATSGTIFTLAPGA